MSVERMNMLNLVAPIEYMDELVKEIVLFGKLHVVNAMVEINDSNFTIALDKENIHEISEMAMIHSYKDQQNLRTFRYQLEDLMTFLNIGKDVKLQHLSDKYFFEETAKTLNEIYQDVNAFRKKIEAKKSELNKLDTIKNYLGMMKLVDFDLKMLNRMKYFNYEVGILSREGREKIKKNYENIPAIVLHIGKVEKGEVYLIISLKEFAVETDRILRSLNFSKLSIPKDFVGRPSEIEDFISEQAEILNVEIEQLEAEKKVLREKYYKEIEKAFAQNEMEEAKAIIKNNIACTENFFYLSGWVPSKEKGKLTARLTGYNEKVILVFKSTKEVYNYIIPPTKLSNPKIFKPFEPLIKMYGIPSYDEIDPTLFLSLSYMFLFGAMFGDVGQGMIIFLMGLFAYKRTSFNVYGQIFMRLGISSVIFGFLYGSIFGFEDILPALFLRPMENINTMLFSSVIVGAIFLFISFSIGIINAIRKRDIKEGIFGRNGICGFVFFMSLLAILSNMTLGIEIVPVNNLIPIMVLCILLIVVREPLTHLLLKKRPLYDESPSSYYTESIFEGLETIINILSNTISFIRVGAFALNHVGLFMAFHTMAQLANNKTAGVLIYIIGNVIVIGLEGLIVFIQGLRLEYYEMFSKYFVGEGIEYNPVTLEI
ncbi:MAG: V-type ATP synthase subunit I [Clostridiales bacterium]|nr:V-type ATP synthase subunit I [Clostridiales bacterium]